jgi:hypothetical protein
VRRQIVVPLVTGLTIGTKYLNGYGTGARYDGTFGGNVDDTDFFANVSPMSVVARQHMFL